MKIVKFLIRILYYCLVPKNGNYKSLSYITLGVEIWNSLPLWLLHYIKSMPRQYYFVFYVNTFTWFFCDQMNYNGRREWRIVIITIRLLSQCYAEKFQQIVQLRRTQEYYKIVNTCFSALKRQLSVNLSLTSHTA